LLFNVFFFAWWFELGGLMLVRQILYHLSHFVLLLESV
jgi:hypothetical protein